MNFRVLPIDGLTDKLAQEIEIYINDYSIDLFIDEPILLNFFLTLMKFSSLDLNFNINLLTKQNYFLNTLETIVEYPINFKDKFYGNKDFRSLFITKYIYCNPLEWIKNNNKSIEFWYYYLPINTDFLKIFPIERNKKIYLHDNFTLLAIFNDFYSKKEWLNNKKYFKLGAFVLNLFDKKSYLSGLNYATEINIKNIKELMNFIRISKNILTDDLGIALFSLILKKPTCIIADDFIYKIKDFIIPNQLKRFIIGIFHFKDKLFKIITRL